MKNQIIYNIKDEALKNKIPIIQDDGLKFLLSLIKKHNVKSVLEIGSAVGYSAINMAALGVRVVTIERDMEMCDELTKNIKLTELSDLIFPICADALNIEINEKFDLIFIDAAKAQYQKFFEKFEKNLKNEGLIVCDNLDFHHLDPAKVSRQTRQLLKKIEKFKQFLYTNNQYITNIFSIGDGISVSKRKET